MDNRIARPVPHELGREIAIKLEEGLFEQAIWDLKTLSDVRKGGGTVYVPDPQLLSVLLTLAVHPHFTNRTRDKSAVKVPGAAIGYLRALNQDVGALDSGLQEALTWPVSLQTTRLGIRRSKAEHEGHDVSPFSAKSANQIRTEYAKDKSVFNRSTDFWQVAGWAFRCSILHPRRWQAWSLWIEFVIEVLERDWRARDGDLQKQQDSLIARYFDSGDQATAVIRSIFADGGKRSSYFAEIWKNETKPPPKGKDDGGGPKKQDINFEQGTYGDYMDPSSQEDEEDDRYDYAGYDDDFSRTPAAGEDLAVWGGHRAGLLRMRLLSLVLQAAYSRPDGHSDFERVLRRVLDELRPLPIPAFRTALSPAVTDPYFPRHIMAQLLKCTASSIIQSGVEPCPAGSDDLTPELLVRHYLPYAANTNLVVDNTRMSICCEYLLHAVPHLRHSAELESAVKRGIAARKDKATRIKGPKGEVSGSAGEAEDRLALRQSGAMMEMRLAITEL